jgi:L-asparagine transporter-like permease
MRRHFLTYRWVWLAIAVTMIVANELIDRNFFDHREHIDGDVVVTLLVLLLSFFGSYMVAAVLRRRRRAAT